MVPDDLYDHVQPVWCLGACRTLVSLIVRTTSKGRQKGSKESLLYSANSSDHSNRHAGFDADHLPFPGNHLMWPEKVSFRLVCIVLMRAICAKP